MDVQVRSEQTGINTYNTVREAYEAMTRDPSIWKISWEGHRFRRISKRELLAWKPTTIARIRELYNTFDSIPAETLLWIDQLGMAPNFRKIELRNDLTSQQKTDMQDAECIREVLNVVDFEKKYVH